MQRKWFGWTVILGLVIGSEMLGCTPTSTPGSTGEAGAGGQGGNESVSVSSSSGQGAGGTGGAVGSGGSGGSGGMVVENATLLLEITDETTRLPVAGAQVWIGATNTTTNDAGQAYLEDITPGKTIVRVDAPGFVPAMQVATLDSGVHAASSLFLLPRGSALSFNADTGGTVEKNGVIVKIPPQAVADAQGMVVSGLVDVTISPIDPTTDAILASPGPLEGLPLGSSTAVPLASFFMADISLWQNGLPLNLVTGKKAELTFPIPTPLLSSVNLGDIIPAWWFDVEAAAWREEGQGTIVETNGQKTWVANVAHFTPWNADKVADTTCVDINVQNPMNQGLPGILVRVRGIDYQGQITSGLTNVQGRLCLPMARGGTAEVQVLTPSGTVLASSTVTGSSAANACGSAACTPANLVISIPCAPLGVITPCPGGPPNVGLCQTGTRYCSTAGWGPCIGQVLPKTELCNNLDENCDGQADEGDPGGGSACNTMLQGVCADGLSKCVNGMITCEATKMPTMETCNNLDDDCNGQVDEGNPGGGASCLTGDPMPCDQGVLTCQTGTLLCVASMMCPMMTCIDMMKNGNETDVDCGGNTCPACADGDSCLMGNDCTSKVCTGMVCQVPTCNDGVKNGNETDVNCGGTCAACGIGKACIVGTDCTSKVCTMNVCQAATCMDGVKNNTETDIDCGSAACPKCPVGKSCNVNSDCQTFKCIMNVCSP